MTDRELMQQALEALDAYSWEQVQAATAALRERLAQHSEMDKAIAAGDGTLHGAIDYWQEEARRYAQNADFWRSEAEKTQPEMQPCAGRNCGSTNPNLKG